MATDFTKQELDLLFDAVEAWERNITAVASVAVLPFLPDHPFDPDKQSQIEQAIERNKADRKRHSERACLLRAKIIGVRDEVDLQDFLDSSKPD